MAKNLQDFKRENDPTFVVENPAPVFKRKLRRGCRVFIITAAQNGTPVHADFWAILQNIAKLREAEILVIPLRYKNPTSQWTGSQQNEEYWDVAVQPFLWNQRHVLNENLTLLADIKTQPTAISPLTGNDALSLAASGILGHTKLQLRCIPTPSNRMAKVLTTTGACTVENYTDSRAGKIGEFHHSLSATVVELEGKRFHLRQLNFDKDTCSVTDLGLRYTHDAANVAPRPLALVMGDTHVGFVDPGVERATFGPGGMVAALNPMHLVWHDLLDAYSCNPHHLGNPFNAIAKHGDGADNVRREVNRAIQYVVDHTPAGIKSVLVGSNHNDMLHRWVKRADWRNDPLNAEFYLETALAMVKDTKMGPGGTVYPDPFVYWFRKNVSHMDPRRERFQALDSDQSFIMRGVEMGMHGDVGPNGTRGSIRNLRRLGVKSIIGHSHTPGIDEGCTQVGTSTRLRLEYNHGASAWLNAHCLLNADGKRQLVIIVDGKWRS
jgi:hypothetical protein